MLGLLISIIFALIDISKANGFPLIVGLSDDAFSSNSQWPENANPHAHCLDENARRSSGHGWCARSEDIDLQVAYVQFDLGGEYEIESFSTWPRWDAQHQYVKTYKLSYSLDGVEWTDYNDGQVLNGNQATGTGVDAVDEANTILDPPIYLAKHLRITPLSRGNHMSGRFEAYGGTDTCTYII